MDTVSCRVAWMYYKRCSCNLHNQIRFDQISESIDEPDQLEDVDHCVYYYNKALLYYHMCQYQKALDIGENLVQVS